MKNSSVKIEAIKTDSNGYKLIAFSNVIDFPGCKPQVTPCKFADYKDNELRVFWGSSFNSYSLPSFKSALMFLRNSNFNY